MLERIARVASQYITLLGTLLTAASVYAAPNTRQPDPFSRYFSAPLVIIAVVLAVVLSAVWLGILPQHVVNGFALLGISGALSRLLRR